MKNQKLHSLIICALLISAIFSMVLISIDVASATTGFPLTIRDANGREVIINASVDGIITMNTDAAEAVTILGKQDKIIGISEGVRDESRLFPEISQREVVGTWREANSEAILRISQNLSSVIILAYARWPSPESLENRLVGIPNITVIRLDFYKPDTLRSEMITLGKILEAKDRANLYIEMHDRIVNNIRNVVAEIPSNERVLVFTGTSPIPPRATGPDVTGWRAAGPGTGTYGLAEMAGARNINTGKGRDFFDISLEWLLKEKPKKVMLWGGMGGYDTDCPSRLREERFIPFINAPGARAIPAVPYNVFVFDSDVGTSPAFFVTLATLVEWWYPAKFNLCPQSIHQEYLDTFFSGLGFNVRTQGAFVYHRIPILLLDPGVTPPPIKKELIVITPVAPAIIEIEDSVEIEIMKAGVPVSIDLKKTNITEITITTLTDVSNIPLRVQQLTERPAKVPEIPDRVYQYFSITTGIETKYIHNATIKFNVSKSWINKTNISIDSIRLNRFNITAMQWDVLPTELIRKDVNHIIFSAETPHFSIFSVTGKEVVKLPVKEQRVVPPLTGINVSDATILVGRDHTFRALPIPVNATIGNVTWRVENITIGTITIDGVFTALSAGTTNITARYGNFTGTTRVTVPAPPPVAPSAQPDLPAQPAQPTPPAIPAIPGFGIIATIVGILGMALILLKKKN